MNKKVLMIPLFAGLLAAAPFATVEASHWLQARQLARLQSNSARLASLWITYALGDPTFNPTGETGNVDCRRGQPAPGRVTILTGTFGGTTQRSCAVPARTPLFFPVLNNIFINSTTDVACVADPDCAFVDGSCNAAGFCDTGYSVQDKVDILEQFFAVDDQCDLRVWLDSDQIYPAASSIPLLRTPSEPTTATNPSSGFVDHETMASGHWALVPGLSRGPHVLRFAGKTRASDGSCGGSDGFSLDVTYNLDVGGRRH